MLRNSFKNAATWEKSAFFFFFFSYQKLGVRLIHVCAVYTRLYGNENIRKFTFFLSCYCRAEKYGFPQQNTDFGVWEYWKAQIQLGSSGGDLRQLLPLKARAVLNVPIALWLASEPLPALRARTVCSPIHGVCMCIVQCNAMQRRSALTAAWQAPFINNVW